MLFIGAGGFAAQMFGDLVSSNMQEVVFWSEVECKHDFIKDKYKIISTDAEVIEYFENVSRAFVLCIGDIVTRKKAVQRFINLGGRPASYISHNSRTPYMKSIGKAVMILNEVDLEPDIVVGDYCLLNKYSKYGHGCIIGNNCEVGPFAVISAYAEIGDDTLIGISSLIHPKVKIGKNVIVSAGSVVTKNIPDNAVVQGNPAIVRFYRKTPTNP